MTRANHFGHTQHLPLFLSSGRFRRSRLSQHLERSLDRVDVLGNDLSGHTGCVNALSWANNGDLLISGGDDTTIRLWAVDAADTSRDYPYTCRSVVQTGHRANIFSSQMLPYSSRIATVAGDHQVRVFDLGEGLNNTAPNGRETSYSARQSCTHILRCHHDRVKRIVTEHSPDLFLTVSEDGAVRQHDLRTSHDCQRGPCPAPLVKIDHELSTLALSPLTPYHFVVAGDAPYGYLFDRRHVGRDLREEWGIPATATDDSSLTTCVRRFGRPNKSADERGRRSYRQDHITGARMSAYNGHEVLLTFSGDAVYLYSTYDHPNSEDVSSLSSQPAILSPGPKRRRIEEKIADVSSNSNPDRRDDYLSLNTLGDQMNSDDHMNEDVDYSDEEHDDNSDEEGDHSELVGMVEADEDDMYPNIPIVLPRQRYFGARNVATVKDVNFLGPMDELVTSGSDDGNFFIWHKTTGALRGIYEGDGSVVNMVEGHPYLPLIAVSGIDYTVKLFAPSHASSEFSRTLDATEIMERNARLSRARPTRLHFSGAIAAFLADRGLSIAATNPECRNQ